jgi:hypothetical protein
MYLKTTSNRFCTNQRNWAEIRKSVTLAKTNENMNKNILNRSWEILQVFLYWDAQIQNENPRGMSFTYPELADKKRQLAEGPGRSAPMEI